MELGIIGGGIAGLTLAIGLRDSGINCHIFEKNTAFKELGAAISIFPNALRVYRQNGLLQEILDVSGEFSEVFLRTSKGKILSKSNPKYELPAICMHRADLHAILLRHVPAALYSNHALETFEMQADGRIRITFTNGEQKTVDALIGADGIHSKVRKLILEDSQPVFRGYNIWRGVCESDISTGYGSETYGKGKRVGIVPISEGKFGWWATMNEDLLTEDEPGGTKAKLMRQFGDWHSPIPELISNTENIIKNSISDRVPIRGWSKDKIVLLGDAAHPTTPNLGQGGCMAIEGAHLLAQCIRKYGLTEIAFQRYEELHFPRSKDVVETSLKMGRIGQLENPVAIGFRNTLMRLMPDEISMKLIDKYFAYDVTAIVV